VSSILAVQITCFIKSSADQEKDGNQWQDGSGAEIDLPTLCLAISQLRTEVDFIANFPEIHPIFPANSRSKSKLLTFRKLIRECSKVSFARGLFRKRDGAGIAPYQQGLLNHILPSNE
jgi:hypothetical protein